MAQMAIRAATVSDISALVRQRRLMWWDMGRRDEAALDLMEAAAREYFVRAVPDGSYRGFLAVNADGQIIGGGGIVISAWPGVLGSVRQNERWCSTFTWNAISAVAAWLVS